MTNHVCHLVFTVLIHTLVYVPWRYKNVIWFREQGMAYRFERYLKSESGRSFATCIFDWLRWKGQKENVARMKQKAFHPGLLRNLWARHLERHGET